MTKCVWQLRTHFVVCQKLIQIAAIQRALARSCKEVIKENNFLDGERIEGIPEVIEELKMIDCE